MLKSSGLKFFFVLLLIQASVTFAFSAKPAYYYQLKVFSYKTGAQETLLDQYLKDAFLPALHRYGVKHIGVFKPVAKDSLSQLVYVLIPYRKIDAFLNVDGLLQKDQAYQTAASAYLNSAYDAAPYIRVESTLLKAFSAMPEYALPNLSGPKRERIYELRSYEAATEKLSENKIGMFNDAEVEIFSKLNFNAVFYGQVISGSKMPNLMYLTTFENKKDRDEHWAAFGPEYKKISGLPQYQHNVSKNVTLFLYPTDYSDI